MGRRNTISQSTSTFQNLKSPDPTWNATVYGQVALERYLVPVVRMVVCLEYRVIVCRFFFGHRFEDIDQGIISENKSRSRGESGFCLFKVRNPAYGAPH